MILEQILKHYENYDRGAIRMRNNRTERFPYIVAMVQSAKDISKAILFARNHTMKITVLSSGHDYIGRSTADMSLQINVSRMKGRVFNLNSTRNPAGEITAEAGNTWIEIYREVRILFLAYPTGISVNPTGARKCRLT